MLALLTAAALVLSPAVPAPRQGAAETVAIDAEAEAAFLEELDDIQDLIRRRRWKDATKRYQVLFADHAGAQYVVDRRASIEADLKRCAFWTAHAEPQLADLLAAKLERWDRYRGGIRLAFDREHLGDLTVHRSPLGSLYELPAVWSETWTATFEGPAKTLEQNQVYVIVDDELTYVVALGHKTAGSVTYYQHALTKSEGKELTPLAQAVPADTPGDKEVSARITVTADRIRLEVERKKVLDVRRSDGRGLGRMAFSFDGAGEGGDFGTLTVEGNVETGWFDGLVDAVVQEARDAFDGAWDPRLHLPEWLATAARPGTDGAGELPHLGPFPVPETFDLAVEVHPRTEEHVRRIETFLHSGRHADAMRYLGDLVPEDVEPTVRAFLGTIVLMVSDRPREAFAVGERLWTAQPGSLTAGYLEAVLLAQLEHTDLALERFERLTEDHADAWEPWYGLSSLLLLQRRVSDATATLERGRRRALDPGQLFRLEDRLALLVKGPPWHRTFEADALHFRVRSDTDARTTLAVAQEVEQAWRTYERVLGKVAIPKGETIPLFLFSGEATYRAYAQTALTADMQHTAGLFSRDLQVVLVWNTPSPETLLQTIRHEVLHQYLDARMGALPVWFNEGLAEYYEIAAVERGLPLLGEPHRAHVARLREMREVPDLRALIRLSPQEFYADAQNTYTVAWAFVHFLRHTTLGRKQRFDALWERLDAGADGASAMDGAFDGVDWDAWNQDFREYLTALTAERR